MALHEDAKQPSHQTIVVASCLRDESLLLSRSQNMKLLLSATMLISAATWIAAQSPSVTHVDAQKVAEALAKGGALVTASNLTVSGNHRAVPGQVEVHEKETDILYIVEGDATFVTGGTMTGGRQTAPGQMR